MKPASLGQLVRRHRRRARMTQGELARRAGLSSAIHVAMIESGVRRACSPTVLWGLARALKIDGNRILEIASRKA